MNEAKKVKELSNRNAFKERMNLCFTSLANSHLQQELINAHFKEYSASSKEDKVHRDRVLALVRTANLDAQVLASGVDIDLIYDAFQSQGFRTTASCLYNKLSDLAFFLLVGKYRDGGEKLPDDFFKSPFPLVFDEFIYDEFPNLANLVSTSNPQ